MVKYGIIKLWQISLKKYLALKSASKGSNNIFFKLNPRAHTTDTKYLTEWLWFEKFSVPQYFAVLLLNYVVVLAIYAVML